MRNRDPQISVVIATVGRAEQLENSLAGYESLDPNTPPFEVIVVLDGEDPASRETCSKPRPFPIQVLSQKRAGPGPARNRGAEAARGELVILLNDDTRPHHNCLLAHTAAQSSLGPCVAVGRVEWDPELHCTPYMAWLAPEGHQFNYGRLDPSQPVPWDACWGTNLAIPSAWLKDEPFDPRFPKAALEDGEWGYRLTRSGRPLRYVPNAVCYHDHRYDGPGDYRQRARTAGAASRYVVRRHPELAWTMIGRPTVAAGLRFVSMLWPGSWHREMLWDADFRSNYVLGILQPRWQEQQR
jgi:GT2 family glycosyltransferase